MAQRSIVQAQGGGAIVYASIDNFNALNALNSTPARKLVSAIRR